MTIPLSNIDRWSDFGRKVLTPPPNNTAKLKAGSIAAIEEIIGHKFNRPHLLGQAMACFFFSVQLHIKISISSDTLIYSGLWSYVLWKAWVCWGCYSWFLCVFIIQWGACRIWPWHRNINSGYSTYIWSWSTVISWCADNVEGMFIIAFPSNLLYKRVYHANQGAMVSNSALAAVCVWSGLHHYLLFESPYLEGSIRAYANELEAKQQAEYVQATKEGRPPGQYWLDIEPPKVVMYIFCMDMFSLRWPNLPTGSFRRGWIYSGRYIHIR